MRPNYEKKKSFKEGELDKIDRILRKRYSRSGMRKPDANSNQKSEFKISYLIY
jgi:hypothetical protein